MIRLFTLNGKRKPKPSGKKKKMQEGSAQDQEEEENLDYDSEAVVETGPARSQANPFAKNQKKTGKNIPEFVGSFLSSNIDALAYDPDKKQLWVRFKGKDVYTYFDVPLQVYRGFWSAPSKGHYFWEKIRKNKHIKYQKLTASVSWFFLGSGISLNSNKQANTASVAKSFKNKAKLLHPEWEVSPNVISVMNGHRVDFRDFLVDIVRYTNKVRVDILDKATQRVDFSATTETDTAKIVDFILKRLEKRLPLLKTNSDLLQLKAAEDNNTSIVVDKDALLQLLGYLQESLPEEHWNPNPQPTPEGYTLDSDHYQVTVVPAGQEWSATVYDSWAQKKTVFVSSPVSFVSDLLTKLLCIVLQGTNS